MASVADSAMKPGSFRSLDDTVAAAVDNLLEGLDRRPDESIRAFAERKGFLIVKDGLASADRQILVPDSLASRDANYMIARALVRESRASARLRCTDREHDCPGPPELCEFVESATDRQLEDMLAAALLIPARDFSEAAERARGNARFIAQLFDVPVEAVLQRARNFGLEPMAA